VILRKTTEKNIQFAELTFGISYNLPYPTVVVYSRC